MGNLVRSIFLNGEAAKTLVLLVLNKNQYARPIGTPYVLMHDEWGGTEFLPGKKTAFKKSQDLELIRRVFS